MKKSGKSARSSGKSAIERFFDIFEWLLVHLTFIFSGMFITLWIFNLYNWQMEFLTSKLSNQLMIVYFSTAFLTAGLYIVRRAKRGWPKKRQKEAAPSSRSGARRDPAGLAGVRKDAADMGENGVGDSGK